MDVYPQHGLVYYFPNRVVHAFLIRVVLMVFPSRFPEWIRFGEDYLQQSLFYVWMGRPQ